jgi:hypothetical protein
MMRSLRQREPAHLAEALSRQLNAIHVPHEPGSRISGVHERAIATPTGKLAVIRNADTFTLAPWKPALEPLRGRAVLGLVGPNRVMWTLERGRTLPGQGRAREPCRQSNPRGVRASDKRRNSSGSRRMGLRAALGKETRSVEPNHLGTSGWIMSRAGLCPVAP